MDNESIKFLVGNIIGAGVGISWFKPLEHGFWAAIGLLAIISLFMIFSGATAMLIKDKNLKNWKIFKKRK